ncbi:MAG: 16S rRNA (cytidine(1402)-2'-O)-methyltransferase [Gammaproteobacteria bacterium]|nr:16S rRNA (cytidine(1402)-2'-O)-methyltransferase [Gammaproteobacteria bacterium]
MSIQFGILYVVATPIGNLADITERAKKVLAQVDLVAAEDTRHSGRLLSALGLKKKMLALHDHNERQQAVVVVERLKEGQSVALISDAGTPLISDPGYHLIKLAHEEGVTVSPIPGASALMAALSVSGLPTDRFVFEGFLPARSASRKKRLQELASEQNTLILFESCHRIVDSLRDMLEVFGAERWVAMGRELTKTFETVRRAPLAELLAWVEADPMQQKGEFVLIVAGVEAEVIDESEQQLQRCLLLLLPELPLKKAAGVAAKLVGVGKNQAYQVALVLKNRS